MKKIRIALLRNELPEDHLLWVKALEDYSNDIEYDIGI